MSTQILTVPDDFQFWHTIRFVRMGKLDPSVRRTPNSVELARWFPSGPATLSLKACDTRIEVEAWGPGKDEALAAAPQILGLHVPHVSDLGDARLQRLFHPVLGTRLSRMPSLGYELVQHVLQQQIAWRDAARIWRELVRRHGSVAPGDRGLMLPPSFEQLRALPLHELQALSLPSWRARALREVGRLGYRIDRWYEASPQEFVDRIRHVRGIGPWTAYHALGVAMGEPDVVVPGDYALPHTVCWVLEGTRRGTDQRMRELLEPFRGQRWRIVRLMWALNLAPPRRGPRMAPARGVGG